MRAFAFYHRHATKKDPERDPLSVKKDSSGKPKLRRQIQSIGLALDQQLSQKNSPHSAHSRLAVKNESCFILKISMWWWCVPWNTI